MHQALLVNKWIALVVEMSKEIRTEMLGTFRLQLDYGIDR
jgi:hypothetical protein